MVFYLKLENMHYKFNATLDTMYADYLPIENLNIVYVDNADIVHTR